MRGKWASVRKGERCQREERGENEEINHTNVKNSTNKCKIGKKVQVRNM